MNHFLDIHKTDPDALRSILSSAQSMKEARQGRSKGARDDEQPLAGRMVALIFEKPSTRTRVSFDVGVRQMGGETLVLTGSEMQLGHGETIADTARVLSRYVDMIMIRTFDEEALLELAKKNAWALSAGHSFIIFMKDMFPINVLNAIQNVPEVCRIYCATANPVEVVIAETELGRGILGVIDGFASKAIESEDDR